MGLSIIILAAGQGTRMRSALPKVLQPLAGRPLLAHVIDCSRQLAADDICIVHGFGGDAVQSAFGSAGLRWALQVDQLGTGHAVQQAMAKTPDANRVLILYGDVPLLMPATLKRMLDETPPDSMAVLTVRTDNPQGYGRIVRRNDTVAAIVEENDANSEQRKIDEINTGVMLCPAQRLKKWLGSLSNDNAQGEYYLTDVIAMAVCDDIDVHAIVAGNTLEVMGINDKMQLAQAERALQARLANDLMAQGVGFADPARVDIRGTLACGADVFIDANVVFEGAVTLGNGVHIESNNVIRNCHIGDHTVVHPNCHFDGASTGRHCELGPFARLRPGTELADNVKVGNFVEIKKSRIDDSSKVNHLSYIGDTQMGKNVNVGAGTITCNYDGANKHLTVIGEGAFIGSGVNLVAPVTVGKGATVGAGSTVTKPAPDNALTVERSKQITVEGWQRPVKKP